MMLGYSILVHIVWFLSTYFIVVFLLALLKNKSRLYKSPKFGKNNYLPKVSIVISAYNEEEKIAESIESLKAVDYPKELYEVIIVNDGSRDRTSEVVLKYADGKNIAFVDNIENKGKAAALTRALKWQKGIMLHAWTLIP